MDVGPAADGHGMTEDNVGGANASLPDANVTPAGQSTRLYLLFKEEVRGELRRLGGKDSSTGELSPGGCGRIASGCRAGRRGNRGSCRARPRYLAG